MKRKFLSKKHMAVILSAALAVGSLSMVPAEFAGMATVYAEDAGSTEEPAEEPGFQFEIAEEEGATGAQWVAGEDGNGSLILDMGAASTLKIKGEVTDLTVEWKDSESEKEETAKVIKVEDAQDGKKVTALNPGKATITATIPAKEESAATKEGEENTPAPQAVLTCEVTVLNYYLAGAEGTELNEEGNLTLDLNGEGNLEIKGDLTDKEVEWKATNPDGTSVIELTSGGAEETREQDAQAQGTASIKATNPGTAIVTATISEKKAQEAQEETEGDEETAEPITLTCEVEVLDYYLSADALDLKVGGTGSLEVKGVPANGNIVWATKDEKVATVAEGTVTAVNPGTTEVTASIMAAEATEAENEEETPEPLKVLTCKVTVADYELEPTAMELDLDEPTKTLVLKAKEDVTFENVTVTAVSNDPEAVSVEEVKEAEEAEGTEEELPSKQFTVTAKQAGEAQITVTIVKNEAQQAEEGEEAEAVPETHTCFVTVAEKAVESVTLSPKTAKVTAGKTVTLTAAVAPENATNKAVTWSTSDSGKATVENGVVTGIAAGEVTITATSVSDETKKDTCTVTVEAAGGTGNGGSNNGGTGNGGSNNGGTGNTNPTTVAVTGITLNKTSISLNKGKTEVLTATVAPANATNKTVTWSTSNAKVATVANGTVTAVGKGTATITAKAGDKTATCTVNVTETKAKVAAKKVVLNTKQIYMVKGKSVTVKATVTPSNTTDKVKWSTSNKKVATVKNGKISGKKTGKATITAKAGSKKATVKVNVVSKAKKSTKVTLNKKKATLKVKKTLTLKATLKPAKSTDTIKWSSSNKKVAKVDKFGTVTAVKKGKATITAKTSSGKKATCKITVK